MNDTTRRAHVALALTDLKAGFPLIATAKVHLRHAEGEECLDQQLSHAERGLDTALEELAEAIRVLDAFCASAVVDGLDARAAGPEGQIH